MLISVDATALESCIGPMNPITHPAGCFEIAQTNVNVDRAREIGCGQLKQFEESWPGNYIDGWIRCSLDSYLTNKRNCRHIFIPGFKGWCYVRLFEADANHALIGMMITLPKVLLGLLTILLQ